MCGLAGFLDFADRISNREQRVAILQAALRHRGPDDQGAWTSPGRVAHLVHTRLAILDLSAAGHQPMSLPGGRLTMTFNGEIYNFRELRTWLECKGVVFHTGTDTEVLLRLYEHEGPALLDRLRGMFAFAIWDEREQSCFLARDPFGIKPLYYSVQGDVLAFASELKALQQAGFGGSDLDAQALLGYFETGSVAEPRTLLQDVRCLEAGHSLYWRAGVVSKKAWWQIRFPNQQDAPANNVSQFVREALLESTRRHFVSDVPVGIFLSGGLDSTALVALARLIGIQDMATFSIGVDEPGLDESSTARLTASHFKTDHHELLLGDAEGMRRFEDFIHHIDQPSIDGFNTFTVSSLARESGMKVVLSGLGGDEIFAGYPSFAKVPRLVAYARLLDRIPGIRHRLGKGLEAHTTSPRLQRLGTFLQSANTVRNAYRAFRGVFSRRAACRLTARTLGLSLPDLLHGQLEETPLLSAPTPRDEVSLCELSLYMRNQLLKDSDVMSMSQGLELRVPFVDRTLFDSVAGIPAAIRLRQGKQLLIEALPEIPQWVVNQPKRGFLFPYQRWAYTTWGGLFAEANARIPINQPTWYQSWAVFMLDRWLEQRGLSPGGSR